jgi:hypothetical protein
MLVWASEVRYAKSSAYYGRAYGCQPCRTFLDAEIAQGYLYRANPESAATAAATARVAILVFGHSDDSYDSDAEAEASCSCTGRGGSTDGGGQG